MSLPRCPTCHKPAPPDSPQAPFCSTRCKQADLGAWLTEAYRIPAHQVDPQDGLDVPGNVPAPDGEQ